MGEVLLTKRIEFAAAHRYHNPAWDAARNRAVFGLCNNEHGHGHNYLLEVTVAGEVEGPTGMVVNLYDLKSMLLEVLEEFDHKHLNLDTPYFRDQIPTGENIAHVLWKILEGHPEIGRLQRVRLYEDEDLYADVTAEMIAAASNGARQASLTRRYPFSAAHRLDASGFTDEQNRRWFGACAGGPAHGHDYVLEVTVQGTIGTETGMVTDIAALDRLVRDTVLQALDHQDLPRVPALGAAVPSGEVLARFAWTTLDAKLSSGRLERVRLYETQDTYYDVSASNAD